MQNEKCKVQSAKFMIMKQYEYLCVSEGLPVTAGQNLEKVQVTLDASGRIGWELVAVLPGRGSEVLMFFKREAVPVPSAEVEKEAAVETVATPQMPTEAEVQMITERMTKDQAAVPPPLMTKAQRRGR